MRWQIGMMVMLLNMAHGIAVAQDLSDQQIQQLFKDNNNQLQQQQKRLEQLRDYQETVPDVRIETDKTATPRKTDQDSPCFLIEKIRLDVADDKASERFSFALSAVMNDDAPLIGQCLGVNGINAVMSQVQNAIVQRGYITTRVLVAPQDLNSGELVLTIVPGRIRQIQRDVPDRLLWTAFPFATRPNGSSLLNIRDIEQGLENIRRIPTADADIQITPSTVVDALPGDSDLILAHQQQRPYRLALSLDDSGYESTGRYQAGVTLSLDNLLDMNDLLYLNLNQDISDGQDGETSGHVFHYSLPYGYWLLSFTSSENEYFQQVAGINQSYEYQGESERYQIDLKRILYRDASSKLALSFSPYLKTYRNFIDKTEIEVQRRRVSGWIAGLSYRKFWGQSVVDMDLQYQRGTGAFNARSAPESVFDSEYSRPEIIRAQLDFSVPFQLGSAQLFYQTHIESQWNKTPLIAQDKFSIAGRYTVRGFDGESTLSAERGWFIRNDLALRLGESNHQLYLGADFGHVSGPSSEYLLGSSLAGVAVGLRGNWNNLSYDVFAGMPIDKPDGFEAGRMLGFNLIYQY